VWLKEHLIAREKKRETFLEISALGIDLSLCFLSQLCAYTGRDGAVGAEQVLDCMVERWD
jgi:hypothetical protein